MSDRDVSPETASDLSNLNVMQRSGIPLFPGDEEESYIFNVDNLLGSPEASRAFIGQVVGFVEENNLDYDVLAVPDKQVGPSGFVPFVGEISDRLEVPTTVVRTDTTSRLSEAQVRGHNPEGKSVLMLDDFPVDGYEQARAVERIESQGGEVEGVLFAYARDDDILDHIADENDIPYTEAMTTQRTMQDLGIIFPKDADLHEASYPEDFYNALDGEISESQQDIERQVNDIVEEILEEAGAEAMPETEEWLENLYFLSAIHVNQDEVYDLQVPKTDSRTQVFRDYLSNIRDRIYDFNM
jgi:orotate phosphoribosyltransferase